MHLSEHEEGEHIKFTWMLWANKRHRAILFDHLVGELLQLAELRRSSVRAVLVGCSSGKSAGLFYILSTSIAARRNKSEMSAPQDKEHRVLAGKPAGINKIGIVILPANSVTSFR